jgi:hypothetical protein
MDFLATIVHFFLVPPEIIHIPMDNLTKFKLSTARHLFLRRL